MACSISSANANDIPALTELLGLLFSLEQDMQPDGEKQARGLALLLQDTQRARVMSRSAL